MAGDVILRAVNEGDLPIFFEQQLDPDATAKAAFSPRSREAFMVYWSRILSDDIVIKRAIFYNGQVAGNVVCIEQSCEREVGSWIGKDYWGKGVATRALAAFLRHIPTRLPYAHAAKDTVSSIRVLEKCGFTLCGEGWGGANARGEQVEALIFILRSPGP